MGKNEEEMCECSSYYVQKMLEKEKVKKRSVSVACHRVWTGARNTEERGSTGDAPLSRHDASVQRADEELLGAGAWQQTHL